MVQDSNGLGHAPVYESSEMEPYVGVSSEVEGLLWYVRYKVLGGFLVVRRKKKGGLGDGKTEQVSRATSG